MSVKILSSSTLESVRYNLNSNSSKACVTRGSRSSYSSALNSIRSWKSRLAQLSATRRATFAWNRTTCKHSRPGTAHNQEVQITTISYFLSSGVLSVDLDMQSSLRRGAPRPWSLLSRAQCADLPKLKPGRCILCLQDRPLRGNPTAANCARRRCYSTLRDVRLDSYFHPGPADTLH